ncbi:MAG: alpha/beta fold hydrolase [Chitinophagales bacterium]
MQMRTTPQKFQKAFEANSYQPIFQKYEFDGREMNYVEIGDTSLPTIIFIHGAPGSLDAFETYLQDEDLLKQAHLISVDRAGYGYSDFGKSEVFIEKQAALLQPILEKKKQHKPLLLVGHSYGGPISARLAMDFPDLVDAMLLLAPALSPEDERVFWVSYPADFFLIKWLLPKPIRVSNDEKLAHAEELRKMLPFWKNVNIPTTIIQGDKDWIVPPTNADFAEKMIAEEYLNLIRIDSASHFLPWTQFDLVKKLILEQLDELEQEYKKQ